MAIPTVVNGDFSVPALTPGNFVTNPTGAGVGWTWDPGVGSNWCRVYGPGANSWPDQSASLFANNSSSTESACYQDLAFDGSPCRLKITARRVSTHGRLRVTVGDLVLIDETGVTGTWTDWHEFVFEIAPAAGVHRLRIANRGYTGHQVGLARVVIESAGGGSVLLCLQPDVHGLVG
ncbi:hypothetical protein [Paludisphaera sp.]|uniref:hypothetical protein n=1 Tax=Paludisphaera sp. TaxID=2017432 RepID=UPI00301D9C16